MRGCPYTGNNVLRVYDLDSLTGNISTYAGTGIAACSADGSSATATALNRPDGLAFDSVNGVLFASEPLCHRVRAISFLTGLVTTVVGTGISGSSVDGMLGYLSMINAPKGLCLDESLDLYITGVCLLLRLVPVPLFFSLAI